MAFHAPQLIMIALYAASITLGIVNFGEKNKSRRQGWLDIIVPCALLYVLWWGGFFE